MFQCRAIVDFLISRLVGRRATPFKKHYLFHSAGVAQLLAPEDFPVEKALRSCLCGSFFGLYLWAQVLITGGATPTDSMVLSLLIVLQFKLILQAIVVDIQETPR